MTLGGSGHYCVKLVTVYSARQCDYEPQEVNFSILVTR